MSKIYKGEEAKAVWNGKTGIDCNLEWRSPHTGILAFEGYAGDNTPKFSEFTEYRLVESKDNSANDKQVDGTHYQTEIQPWDFIEANKLTFLEGNVIKYVCRHRAKNGVRDLMKAKHYLEKLIEVEQSKPLGDSDED